MVQNSKVTITHYQKNRTDCIRVTFNFSQTVIVQSDIYRHMKRREIRGRQHSQSCVWCLWLQESQVSLWVLQRSPGQLITLCQCPTSPAFCITITPIYNTCTKHVQDQRLNNSFSCKQHRAMGCHLTYGITVLPATTLSIQLQTKTRSSAVAEGLHDVHVIWKCGYIVFTIVNPS